LSALRGIYAIVDASATPDPEALADAVLRAGIRVLQYRAKRGVDRRLVRRLHRRAAAAGGALIVNDDLEAALDADGLHAGQEDLAALGSDVRARLGARILGVSCGTPADARAARALGADYLGAGPFATTSTKADAGPPIGAAGIAAIVSAAGDRPVAAIGGIRLADLGAVIAAGATMAAVVSAIAGAHDPEASARALVERWAALGGT
jgi:thiamine-phosphate pyrophosphorylase